MLGRGRNRTLRSRRLLKVISELPRISCSIGSSVPGSCVTMSLRPILCGLDGRLISICSTLLWLQEQLRERRSRISGVCSSTWFTVSRPNPSLLVGRLPYYPPYYFCWIRARRDDWGDLCF